MLKRIFGPCNHLWRFFKWETEWAKLNKIAYTLENFPELYELGNLYNVTYKKSEQIKIKSNCITAYFFANSDVK